MTAWIDTPAVNVTLNAGTGKSAITGTLRIASFDDPGHGRVTDGTWERDESAGGYLYGSVAKSGEGVEWDQY